MSIKRNYLFAVVFLFCLQAKSQTVYTWNGYPTKCTGAAVYSQGNMVVSVSGTGLANFGPQAGVSSCAASAGNRYYSPKYVVTGNSYAPDWQETGLGLSVNWSNILTTSPDVSVDIDFTEKVCTPLSFSIYDINSGTCCGVPVIWKDVVTISAVDGNGNTIYPLAANVTPLINGNIYNPGTGKIISGNYGATNSNIDISFPPSQAASIKSLRFVYTPGTISNDPYTVGGTDPDPEYIIITSITAYPISSTVTSTPDTCGSNSGTATVIASGGATVFTYLWNPSAQTSSTANNLSAGTYIVTTTDVNGCDVSDTVVVSSAAGITASVNADTTICPGTTVALIASGGNNFLWSTGDTTNIITVTPQADSLFSVEVSSGLCSDTAAVLVSVFPQPVTPTILQIGDTLFATQGFANYQWYFGSALITGADNYFYVATQDGNYNLVVTDSNGCEVGAGILNVLTSAQYAIGSRQLAMFPNPTNGEFTIHDSKFAIERIEIYNLPGEIIYSESLNTKYKILSTNLPAGIYFVKVSTSEKNVVMKLVVQ